MKVHLVDGTYELYAPRCLSASSSDPTSDIGSVSLRETASDRLSPRRLCPRVVPRLSSEAQAHPDGTAHQDFPPCLPSALIYTMRVWIAIAGRTVGSQGIVP